jgi:hypothetical protein
MHRTPFLLTAAAVWALAACTQSAPGNAPAAAPGNAPAAAPGNAPAPAAPAAPAPPAAGNSSGNEAATANSLWGVAEEEDAASHRGIDFVAFNRTGQTVTALSIRPDEGPLDPGAQETPWSANILAQRELPDGTRAAAHYEADIELCRWQLRATFAGGRTRDYPAVNLCDTIRVDLR